MNKEIAKKAYESAENELNNKSVEKLKLVIKATLERVHVLDESIEKLQEEKKILKLDLEDLKEGRLDRIEERQRNDKKSKDVSSVEVVKEIHHHHHYDYWHQPYSIKVKPLPWIPAEKWYVVGNSDPVMTEYIDNSSGAWLGGAFTVTGSVAKNNAVGTFHLTDGHTVHFR